MSARVAAVVLAAGSSSRMGRPKQLIQFDGQSLIRRIVRTVLACDVGALWVTTASNGVDFEAELNGLLWTRAEVTNSQEGQSQSVRAGLHAVEMRGNFDAILFLPCDLPLLSTSHLNALIGEFRSEKWNIVASRFDGVLGAPMIVGRSVWPEVEHLRGDVGARKVLATHPQTTTFIEWEDGKLDLDTPDPFANRTDQFTNPASNPKTLFTNHLTTSNFLFIDGHVKALKPSATATSSIDMWTNDNNTLSGTTITPSAPASLQSAMGTAQNLLQ